MNYKHGLACKKNIDKDYKKWALIKRRCYDSKYFRYSDWGGRGIKMFEPWKENAGLFVEYIKTLENYNNSGYTLDRIDNNKDYEPGNIKYSNTSEQSNNRRLFKNNSTGYKGVSINKIGHYEVYCTSRKFKKRFLGTFDNIEDAISIRNKFIIDNNLEQDGFKLQ